jgi:2-keto-4-pentenoate hydratase/2-oxohepta-3-ene-1,7-dioic acid hydratase in catechol pathway
MRPWTYVEGILPVNDVTARELQRKDSQWTRAKGFDTFCPVGDLVPLEGGGPGPALGGDPPERGGTAAWKARTRWCSPYPFLISYISRIMTLEPGDLVATGTPEGHRAPGPEGDVVEVELVQASAAC